jgi:Tol biopolymer transport system component
MMRTACLRRALVIAGLLVCLLISQIGTAGRSVAAPAVDGPLVVAYIDGDTLYLWRQGEPAPRLLMTGDLSGPQFSPGVTRLLYQDGGALWIVDLDGTGDAIPRPLVTLDSLNPGQDKSRLVLDAAWLDENTVVFNTFRLRPEAMNKRELSDDLWCADLDTGKVSQLLDQGQGGAFVVSPDGQHIALSQPGTERPDPATISVVDGLGQNRVRLLDFPFVYTGASTRFYARPYWLADSSSLLVAIPDPNLVYDAGAARPTILWQLALDGKATQLGSVKADFFALPEFSPDGARILYAWRVGALEDNRLALFQARSDGTDEQEIARDLIQAIEPAHWTPDGAGYTFVRGGPGEVWVQTGSGSSGSSALRRLPGDQELAFDLLWAGADLYVYATSPGPGELRYGTLTQSSGGQPTASIARRTTGGDFDARRKP